MVITLRSSIRDHDFPIDQALQPRKIKDLSAAPPNSGLLATA